MKDKWAIIDDFRELNCDLIAKSGLVGLEMMAANFEDIICLCLDHDLGNPDEMNGYEVLQELFLRNLVPEHVQLVTSNPIGRKNMTNLLIAEGYERSIDGLNFSKIICND